MDSWNRRHEANICPSSTSPTLISTMPKQIFAIFSLMSLFLQLMFLSLRVFYIFIDQVAVADARHVPVVIVEPKSKEKNRPEFFFETKK